MPVAFPDLEQACAPFVSTPAGVVSLQSGFAPFRVPIETSAPLQRQPAPSAEANKVPTSCAATRHDIHIGLDGTGLEERWRSNRSIPGASYHLPNPKAAATLLDGYYRLATRRFADPASAEQVTHAYHRHDDPSVGSLVNCDAQVRREIRLRQLLMAQSTSGDTGEVSRTNYSPNSSQADFVADVAAENTHGEASAIPAAPSWDVFKTRRRSPVLAFQNNQLELEQSE